MIWLYRLQQRLSITRHEALAVLTLSILFVAGLTVRHVQEQQIPPLAVDSLSAQPTAQIAGMSTQDQLSDGAGSAPTADEPLDVNSASAEALQALDGIGPALSNRIVEYRSRQRPFQRVEELRRVRGIGAKTLEDLRPVITVSPESE